MKRMVLAIALAAAVVAYGEDPVQTLCREKADAAIERGLAYLAASQKNDGSYEFRNGRTTAIPALAAMAFLSKGYLPGQKPYGATINRSIDYVLNHCQRNRESPEGDFAYFGQESGGDMYAHAISTLFLAEVSGMVDAERQARIDDVLPAATKLILTAQNVQKDPFHTGGWRYKPNSKDSDFSCTGWNLMALRSVRLNGGAVPPEAIEKAVEFIRKHQANRPGSGNDGQFFYQREDEYPHTLTGAGILCLELCGRHEDTASMRAARWLAKDYPKELANPNGGYVYYGLYYTSQGLFQIGGEYWQNFYEWLCDTHLPLQKEDGSWVGANNQAEESKPYATAMMVLALAVPYRMLPIYQRDETVDED